VDVPTDAAPIGVQPGAGNLTPAAPASDALLRPNETVAEYAKRMNLAAETFLDLGGVKMEMVLVPAGEFEMGSNDGGPEEKPVHKVRISKPFYIAKCETTVAQFRAFADATKYQTECEKGGNKGWTVKDGKWQGDLGGINWRQPGFEQTPEHPVVLVSWNDAQAFYAWLSQQSGRDVRLPTEAQWEYAARGPQSQKYPWGDKWDGTKANHGDISLKNTGFIMWGCTGDNDGFAYTSPVGIYKTGASWCGAFDMAGNVWEWVQDKWNDKYYAQSPDTDPQGPTDGNIRVRRGGSWSYFPNICRSAHRNRDAPGHRNTDIGFRSLIAPGLK
jgi:formylglycine-generating enzyme required for sulfatase activity